MLTVVSSCFPVANKYSNGLDVYLHWFSNTLRINCPYVIFTDEATKPILERYRAGLPTLFITTTLDDFYMNQYKHKMVTHPRHCPSVELNMIWTEKLLMMQQVATQNPFGSEWIMWIDCGICIYRNAPPPPKPFPCADKLTMLPKNKLIFSSSNKIEVSKVTNVNYYHFVSGTYLCHISFIDEFVDLYKQLVAEKLDLTNIWTDQVLLTHLYKIYPHLFHHLCGGYGTIIPHLY